MHCYNVHVVRYLSTLENHTPKNGYWGRRAKLLKYVGHLILTNEGNNTHHPRKTTSKLLLP